MDDSGVRDLVERFWRGFLAADRAALAEVVAEEAAWILPPDTLLSGAHRGPDSIAALRERIAELTHNTWRPLRADSIDVPASLWHGVVLDRFIAERGGRRLDSHEGVVAAVENARIVRLFHYLHNPAGFTAFWSR